MRPGDFSPGNITTQEGENETTSASMRPGDFSPGNLIPSIMSASAGTLLQ